jgi:hypothetical protein
VGALVLVIVGVTLGRMVPLPGRSTPTPTEVAVATPTTVTTPTVPATPQPGPAKPSSPVAAGSPKPAQGPAPSPSPVVAVKPTPPPAKPSPPPAKPTTSPTPQPKPALPPGVLLAEDFERAETGQLPRTSSRPNDYVFNYERGEYVITKINPALQAAPMVILNGPYDNTAIAIDVRLMGDVTSRYVFLVCRNQATSGQSKHYRASIVPDGRQFILSRWDDGQERMLATGANEPAVNPGNARNRLELRCAGTKISASVNGKLVASVDDMTLNRGDHGVGVGAFTGIQGTIEARYDNLEIRSP